MTDKKKDKEERPSLTGFNVKLDQFGRIEHSLSQQEINEYLNEHIDDKKLSNKPKKKKDEEEE